MKKRNVINLLLRTSVIVSVVFLLYGCVALSKSVIAENANRKGAEAYETGDVSLATAYFESAVNINPHFCPAWLNLGMAAAERKEYDVSVEAYNNALECSADTETARLARTGLVSVFNNPSVETPHRRSNWFQQAQEHLRILVEQYPDNPEYRLALGFAFFNNAEPGAGMEHLDTASRLADSPETVWVHEKLCDFYWKINLQDKAEKEQEIMENILSGV